jgi:1-acyl-sn-glycerol-3-phosphate acyltransferase
VVPGRKDRTIAGLSMGGGQAIAVFLHDLDKFRYLATFSGVTYRPILEGMADWLQEHKVNHTSTSTSGPCGTVPGGDCAAAVPGEIDRGSGTGCYHWLEAMSFLRSLLFSAPLIALSTIVMDLISMVVSFFDRSGNSAHEVARVWAKMLLAECFIQVRVEGLERLDRKANYVFVSNHGSYMDIPALLSQLPQQFRFFAKIGLYKIPFLGWHLRWAGHLPVDRSNARASLKSMSEGARIISERRISVLLFPEGGRTLEGLHQFKEGAAYIAIKAGVPLVPIAIVGLRELLPMGSMHIKSGSVTVRVGDPIPTSGMKLDARGPLTLRLHDEVANMLAR